MGTLHRLPTQLNDKVEQELAIQKWIEQKKKEELERRQRNDKVLNSYNIKRCNIPTGSSGSGPVSPATTPS